MKTMYELSKELQVGLFDLHKDSGFDALCREITKRVADMKSEVLTAWFAEHGFEPGKAVLVEERTESGWKVYIRESTAEEAERARTATNKASTPRKCKCVVKQTEVPGMGIIYAQAECPIHGHLLCG
jgi:hypothetical protein